MIMGLDRTYHAHQFIFSSFFYMFCSCRVVDEAGYPSAFYCTLNTQYRVVSVLCQHGLFRIMGGTVESIKYMHLWRHQMTMGGVLLSSSLSYY